MYLLHFAYLGAPPLRPCKGAHSPGDTPTLPPGTESCFPHGERKPLPHIGSSATRMSEATCKPPGYKGDGRAAPPGTGDTPRLEPSESELRSPPSPAQGSPPSRPPIAPTRPDLEFSALRAAPDSSRPTSQRFRPHTPFPHRLGVLTSWRPESSTMEAAPTAPLLRAADRRRGRTPTSHGAIGSRLPPPLMPIGLQQKTGPVNQ